MSVAAVDEKFSIGNFSAFNEFVDVSAPGVDVLSLGNKKDDYVKLTGTSMASPHVAGVAALLMSIYPGASVDDIRHAIEYTARDLGACGYDKLFGHGLVDALAAADFLGGVSQSDLHTSNCVETSISITTDAFGNENRYYIRDDAGRIVYRGGPYQRNEFRTYVDTFDLPAGSGCFEFILEENNRK